MLVFWLLWRLSKNKNELMFKGKDYEVMSVIRKVYEDAEEWQKRRYDELEEVKYIQVKVFTNINQRCLWILLSVNWLKFNSDGAWKKNKENSGFGWLRRDEI